MSRSLYENHWDSPTLTLLNVLGVLGVLNVLHVLHVLNMPMDASLACWALFIFSRILRQGKALLCLVPFYYQLFVHFLVFDGNMALLFRSKISEQQFQFYV